MDDQLVTMEDNVSNKSNGISESSCSRGKKTIKGYCRRRILRLQCYANTLSKQQQDDLLVLIEAFRKSPLNTVRYALPTPINPPHINTPSPCQPSAINPPY